MDTDRRSCAILSRISWKRIPPPCASIICPNLATWTVTAKEAVKSNVANTTTYGTARFTAINLIEDALNGRVPTAYDTIHVDGEEKRVVNERHTLEAREAQQKLKDKFAEWIWKDETRAARLAEIYNEKFNSVRLRTYDGSHLTFPGMNKAVLRNGDLRPAPEECRLAHFAGRQHLAGPLRRCR